ncbi:hypothetical protein ACFL5O_00405 [Myxococcota bacterium]
MDPNVPSPECAVSFVLTKSGCQPFPGRYRLDRAVGAVQPFEPLRCPSRSSPNDASSSDLPQLDDEVDPAPLGWRGLAAVLGGVQGRRRTQNGLRLSCWLLGLLGAVACDFETSGMQTMFDGEPSYVEFPGQRMLSGRFRDTWLDGSDAGGGFVTAVDSDDVLNLVSLPGGERCEVGPVAYYSPLEVRTTSGVVTVVAYLRDLDEAGRGALGFVGTDCTDWFTELKHAAFPHLVGTDGLLVLDRRDAQDALVVVDPWNRTTRELAPAVRELQRTQNGHFWSLEGDELVVRQPDFAEVWRMPEVTQFLLMGDQRAGVIRAGELGIVGQLNPDDWQLVASDVCFVHSADLGPSEELHFLSYATGCDAPELFLYSLPLQRSFPWFLPGTESSQPTAFTPGAEPQVIIDWRTPPYRAFLLTDLEPKPGPLVGNERYEGRRGSVWGGFFDPDTEGELQLERIGDGAQLRHDALAGEPAPRMVIDHDGQSGRLVQWQPGHEPTELARGVSALVRDLTIADYDGQVGNLLALEASETRLLARGVPSLRGAERYTDFEQQRLAVLSEYDGTVGSLTLWFDASKSGGNALGVQPVTVARGVPLWGYHLYAQFPGLAYLRDFDVTSNTGTLEVRFLRTRDTFVRKQGGVSEWHRTNWPAAGIIYTVPDGPDAGVWHAKLK